MSIFEKKIDVFEAFGRLYGLERHQYGLYLVENRVRTTFLGWRTGESAN